MIENFLQWAKAVGVGALTVMVSGLLLYTGWHAIDGFLFWVWSLVPGVVPLGHKEAWLLTAVLVLLLVIVSMALTILRVLGEAVLTFREKRMKKTHENH